MNLAQLDLNLLKAFDALMLERNVTRAAERTGITQPAMSNSLARLRALFDDELFVRTQTEMKPTARARQLADPIQKALRNIERAIAKVSPFDPETAEHSFSIGITDFSVVTLALMLVERLSVKAPRVSIQVKYIDRQAVYTLLKSEQVDIALGVYLTAKEGFDTHFLFDETSTFLMREGHPAAGDFSLEKVLAYPHLLVSPLGAKTGTIDPILAELGLSRDIKVIVPHLVTVPILLENSNLVTAIALSTARQLAPQGRLKIVPGPPEMQYANQVSALYQSRHHSAPEKVWLRDQLEDVAADLQSASPDADPGPVS